MRGREGKLEKHNVVNLHSRSVCVRAIILGEDSQARAEATCRLANVIGALLQTRRRHRLPTY